MLMIFCSQIFLMLFLRYESSSHLGQRRINMRDFLRELLLITGFASFITGIALIYVPAAFISGGAMLLWLCAPGGTAKDKGKQGKS
jgi:hypothetical protein